MTTTDDTPRIYVASLSDYNAGTLHGRWIDATLDVDEINEQVQAMLAASPTFREFPQGGPAEEWAIHDYDNFGSLRLGEYEPFDKVHAIAEAIAEHGAEPIAGWLSGDSTRTVEDFTQVYKGEHDSWQAFVEDWVPEVDYLGLRNLRYLADQGARGEWPKPKTDELFDKIEGFLDWEKIARYVDQEGLFETHQVDGTTYVYETR